MTITTVATGRRILTRTSAVLVGALAASTLFATAATADDTVPVGDSAEVSDDASTVSPDEDGLFELQAPDAEQGGIQARNFTSSVGGWGPGNKESRHWADNDYTEIKFTGCTMDGATGRSLDVQLHQAIPFALDKSLGSKRFTNCFKGSGHTSRGEWDVHSSNGDNRYFTIPKLNGSEYTHARVSVKKVYVDVSKAD
ncbi:hypothetical protein [Streptomyces alboflavus]|uniref:hypothetical protein n=1 Tax=Streptomyces alboflavus TaxID=67267 RepID=UPI0006901258|nr:hypothetical protein [Streptomyces alboflavus]